MNGNQDIHDMEIFETFEDCISSTFAVYAVNDGKNSDYPQETPKERCLAYILNIIHGKELLIHDSFIDCFNQNKDEKHKKAIDMSKYDPSWTPAFNT